MEMNDKIKDPSNLMDENTPDYYTDIYNPGDTKEQLIVGDEVKSKIYKTGEFDTTDEFITTTDNEYTFNIGNPDGEIFSLTATIEGISKTQTFKIGFFNNATLAYSTFTTELKDWLGVEYVVSYSGSGDYSITRADKTIFTLSSPNQTRKITISNTSSISISTITIDGTDFILDGNADDSAATVDLAAQLTATGLYYINSDSVDIVFARKDSGTITISVVTTPKYTYNITGRTENPGLGVNATLANPHIFGYGFGDPVFTESHFIELDGVTYTVDNPTTSSTYTYSNSGTPKTVTGWDQTMLPGSYLVDTIHKELSASYTITDFTVYSSGASLGHINDQASLDFYKNGYGKIIKDDTDNVTFRFNDSSDTLTQNYQQLLVGTGAIPGQESSYIYTEDTNEQVIIDSTPTNITTSLTRDSYNYFIPTQGYPKLIEVNAISSVGESNGTWEKRVQSCKHKSGATNAFISDKIFYIDSNNYGIITQVKRGGFVLTRTTNQSNKINWACTS